MPGTRKYHIATVSWGATQGASLAASSTVELAATGAGTWAAIDGHEVLREGGFAFATGSPMVTHYLYVRFAVSLLADTTLSFRLRDVSNSLTIATATPESIGDTSAYSTTFSNLPASDARVELQYTLVAPRTCLFYWALWDMSRWL